MGKKSKSSRKGKKAWRANISTEDIHEYFDKTTKDALSGGSLADAPSDSIFYLDKSIDLSVKRKIEKHREKVLRHESALQRNTFIKPVPSSRQKKGMQKGKAVQLVKDCGQDQGKEPCITDSKMIDLWGGEGEGEQNIKRERIHKRSVIPAFEVEPPGCSFNPSAESHQDSLAQAVADEMQKIYRKELGPEPVPLTVPGEAIDEEDALFLDVDDGSDDDGEPNENLIESGDMDSGKRRRETKVVTRVEQNRRARRKEQLRAEAEARKKGELCREIDSLQDINDEISKEDEERQKKHQRRLVIKQERLKNGPPRLGKYKFEPAPHQVLLSEEINGSLRKLKACYTLARDRFKSLEKRGLVVPTRKSGRK